MSRMTEQSDPSSPEDPGISTLPKASGPDSQRQPDRKQLIPLLDSPGQSSASPDSRLAFLERKKAALELRLADLQSQQDAHISRLSRDLPETAPEPQPAQTAVAAAKITIQAHIALLKRYNAIKDVGLGLMGLVAESRGVRVAKVLEEFGMSEKD